jgi:Domain of unknown function (DUF4412)
MPFFSNRDRSMRRCFSLLLLPMVAALPVGAQSFEGTLHLKMTNAGGSSDMQNMTAIYLVKGTQMAMLLTVPAGNPMSGSQMRMVYDAPANTMTMLIPMTDAMKGQMGGMLGNAKGLKMVMDMSKIQGDSAVANAKVTKLGTTETIAGLNCDDYEISGNGDHGTVCVTTAIGHFFFPVSGLGRGSRAEPAWAKLFGDKGFPLKFTSSDGKSGMEVTSVERGSVPDSMFAIPGDYMDMSSMLGGRMGGGGGGRRGGGGGR